MNSRFHSSKNFFKLPASWVAESDVPPARVQAASLGEARRRMAAALAVRIGSGALGAATVIEDLPEEAEDGEDSDYARELEPDLAEGEEEA